MIKLKKWFIYDWKEFKKIHPSRLFIIVSILILFFLVGIFIPQILGGTVKINYNWPVKPTPIPVPATLTLSTNKTSIKTGDKFDADLVLTSLNQGVEVADFAINFDPNVLKINSAKTGKYFKNYSPLKTDANSVSVSAAADIQNNKVIIPKGTGTVMTISFEAVRSGNTVVSINKIKTSVISGGKNILGKSEDLILSVK